ncbi:hypothetical protein HBB16_02605 [Pseudonocardia sp. MCCB 268]|nr:hypothetical protein [Pseudonocardia cytotoxica]
MLSIPFVVVCLVLMMRPTRPAALHRRLVQPRRIRRARRALTDGYEDAYHRSQRDDHR